jgi:hypothetical protein
MIVACQVMDPGSIPGERSFFSPSLSISALHRLARAAQGYEQRCILFTAGLKLETELLLFIPVLLQEEPTLACSPYSVLTTQ